MLYVIRVIFWERIIININFKLPVKDFYSDNTKKIDT